MSVSIGQDGHVEAQISDACPALDLGRDSLAGGAVMVGNLSVGSILGQVFWIALAAFDCEQQSIPFDFEAIVTLYACERAKDNPIVFEAVCVLMTDFVRFARCFGRGGVRLSCGSTSLPSSK